MSDYSLKLSKQLPVSPETVFDAWTTPAQMANWISPMTTAEVPKLDLRVGGEYQIDMLGKETTHVHTGKYIEIDRPRKLAFSWLSEGTEQKETIITLEFEPKNDGTLLTLTHERFPSEKSRDNHNGGWSTILDKLANAMAQPSAQ